MGSMPFFPFYPKDWLGSVSVQAMTRSERSVYMDLLACMWDQAPKRGKPCLPADDKFICRLLRATAEEWADWRYALIDGPSPVFSVDKDGMLVNARLLEEWGKATKLSETRSNAGRAGAAGRWGDRGADDMANASQTHSEGNADAMASDKHDDGKSMPSHISHPTSQTTHETGNKGQEAGGALGRRRSAATPQDGPVASPEESRVLAVLRRIDGWPADESADLRMLRAVGDEFADVDLLAVAQAFRIGKLDKPFKPNANPRSQFRTWVAHERQYAAERARASPSDDSAAIDRFLAIGGDE